MAVLTEDHVKVNVTLAVFADGTRHAFVDGTSFDVDGNPLRNIPTVDVTDQLNATQQQAALTLLNAAEAYVKGRFNIS